MRQVLITLAATLFVGWFFASNGQLTFLLPGSQLGFFETRIIGPASEMMRRSPELRANFDKFEACYVLKPKCDLKPILAERDKLVKQEWPGIYRRLEVRQDWDVCAEAPFDCMSTDRDHDDFELVRSKLGPTKLEYDCVLVVRYVAKQDGFGSKSARTVFDSGGYQCGPSNFPYDWEKQAYTK